MDAMGTQRKIAQQIIEQKADYLLALKEINLAYMMMLLFGLNLMEVN